MVEFVLVPGAWHGGWCWKRLIPLLRAAGHAVYPLSLTGLGERAHLASPETGLDTHVRDVTSLLECKDLREVVLVGHSYAGMVVAGAAGRLPMRVKHLLILDGFLPAGGQSLVDIKGAAFLERIKARAERGGCPYLVLPPDDDDFGVTDPADLLWMRARLTPHPLKTFTDPIRIDHPLADGAFGKTFLQCRLPGEPQWNSPQPAFQRVEIEAGHDAMISAPELLARTMLELV